MTVENWGDVMTAQKRILELEKKDDKLAELERTILQYEIDFFCDTELWRMRESSLSYKIKRFFRIE
jgi:hypothetical protein